MKTKVMRTIRAVIALSLVGLLMAVSAGAGPLQQQPSGSEVEWTKYRRNPVLEPGRIGSWDAHMVLEPRVIRDGSIYKMWYAGQDTPFGQPVGAHLSIGYATSFNGINWTKYRDNPVLRPGAPGEWDYENVAGPYVMFDDDIYKMWYHGGVGGIGGLEQIGYATSSGGVNWTKFPGNPVLKVEPGTWEQEKVIDAMVLRQGNFYEMWYSGLGPDDKFRIGYAASPDGLNWAKHPANPVMDVGLAGSFDSNGVRAPSVLYNSIEYTYRMWYTGIDSDGTYRLGYATSYDGINWTKHSGNPILEPGPLGNWDAGLAGLAEIIQDGNIYRMWYTGQGFGRFSIGHALPRATVFNPDTGRTYTTIQAGIDEATSGQEVIASAGTYTENITINFGVSVQGSGADKTVIKGTGIGPTVKVGGAGISLTTVISGFTITGGSFSGGVSAQADGGGVQINGASPSIVNNVIEGNTSTSGGGIYVSNGDPIISNTTIQNNSANSGGGIYIDSGDPTISNNTVQSNDANSGGGIYVHSDNSTISNNAVQSNNSNNTGGGIYIGGGNPNISNNTIQSNDSDANGGGIYIGSGNSNVSNNVIQDNSAPVGGGIYVDSIATPSIRSNTLCGNTYFNLYKNGGILDAGGNWWGTSSPISGTDHNAYVNPDPSIAASMEAVPSTVKILRWGTVTVTLRSGVYQAADGTVIALEVQDGEGRFWDNGPSVVVSTTNGLVSTQMTPLVVKPIEVSAFSDCSGQQVGSVQVTGEPGEVNLPVIMKPTSQ